MRNLRAAASERSARLMWGLAMSLCWMAEPVVFINQVQHKNRCHSESHYCSVLHAFLGRMYNRHWLKRCVNNSQSLAPRKSANEPTFQHSLGLNVGIKDIPTQPIQESFRRRVVGNMVRSGNSIIVRSGRNNFKASTALGVGRTTGSPWG
ncbi:hypothetical protein BC832DRAFT_554527 [Gaertneriomyces semiglobifer]|nr:hypothetical protein BC832DRAFT_554527 [Gaertneriomyces semiglobifer]